MLTKKRIQGIIKSLYHVKVNGRRETMSDWKLHTPDGVNDILPAECRIKKDLISTVEAVMRCAGYKETETPAYEYYDCYIGESGQISQETMFKFFDEHGRILALRPDITTSVARMAATKEAEKPKPQRYMYTGNVFRNELTEGVRQREFTQTGIELIGSYAPEADAEVISTAIEAVIAAGVNEFSVEIGQVAFFRGLTEQASLDAELTERLRDRIDSKDSVAIKRIVNKLDINDDIKELMVSLPYLFGGAEIIDKADVPGLNKMSHEALENIRRIYELLTLYGLEEFISIDLGMLQSINYYTGTIFKCYTNDVSFPVFTGGRYDNLMGKFGASDGAVGAAIGINRLISAAGAEADEEGRVLVYAEKGAEGIAYETSCDLRINGCVTEMYIGEKNLQAVKKYAKNAGCDCIMHIYPEGKLIISDLIKKTETEMTVAEFLGTAEDHCCDDDCCDCHHHDE